MTVMDESNFKAEAMLLFVKLEEDPSDEKLRELISGYAMGLAKALGMVTDHERMHFIAKALFKAIELQACHEQQERYGEVEEGTMLIEDGREVSYETFLRDFFNPQIPND